MVTRLLFAVVLLLLPRLSYGGSTTSTLPIQVVPAAATSACGAIAGQAAGDIAAAGLNTCALFSDWTTQIPNNVGTGLPTNWLNPNNFGWDGVSHWYCGHPFVNGPGFVCNMFSQVTDPVFGNLALRVRADGNSPGDISFTTQAYNGTPEYGIATFPDGAYYEMGWRFSDNDMNNLYAPSLWGDPLAWLGCGGGGAGGFLEEDFYQLGVNAGGQAVSPAIDYWGCGQPLHWSNLTQTFGQDFTQYHTMGFLSTTAGDSAGNIAVCVYWDGQRRGCEVHQYNDPIEYKEHRWIMHQWTTCGNTATGDTSCRGLPWPTIDTYITYIKVMSCPNWKLSGDIGSCHGTALNGTGFYSQ